ncbi:MAG TPA: O-antigen ligase family protein [Pseudomonadales bacterium]|jgi:hypothetical protein
MNALRHAIQQWLLPLGVLLFCCGLFFAGSRNGYKTMVYLTVLGPAIAMVLLSPRASLQAVLGNPARLMLAVFVFWAASSSSWALHQSESDNFIKYAVFIVLFALAFSRPVGIADRALLQVLRVSAGLAGVYALCSVLFWYGLQGHDWHERFSGIRLLYNPLVTGYFMGFFVALLMSEFVAYQQRRYAFLLYLPAVTALIVMVLLTQSRTPLLGWFATAVVLAVVKRNQRAWTLAGLTVVGSALLLAFNDTLWERGLSWRPWIWNHVLERVAEAPWLGHGVGDELLIVIPQNGWLFYDPHNMHLAVLYFTGIIGLALWALLWLFIGQAVWRQRHTPEGLLFLGLLVYGFVASCFDGGYLIERPRENWFILWLPLVLAARLMDPPPKGDA